MKKNMGSFDKLIRLAVSIVIIVLYYTGILPATFAIIVLLVALYLTITSLISFCLIYKLFGMNTCRKDER
ncbi:MAG: DUF2892 domain-containing protein [Paludibacter sp.]